MYSFSYVDIFFRTVLFKLYSSKQQENIRKKRLRKLVSYVRENSPFYKELYKDIPDDFDITDLPIVTKKMVNENFNRLSTDRQINRKDVDAFISDLNNKTEKYLGKYLVVSTSGSTGSPTPFIIDQAALNASCVLSFIYGFGGDMPMAIVCVDEGFGVDNVLLEQNIKKMPILKKFLTNVDVRQPMDKIVAQLNTFKPKSLLGYASSLYTLIPYAKSGELKIHPKTILSSGEFLSDRVRKELSEAFGCEVYSAYGCTEGSTIAFECKHQHKHLIKDWTIIEAAGSDNMPVPDGQSSDKVLLTNLANYSFPLIRYELTDKITLHTEGCPCGNKIPWLEIDGRSSDFISFDGDNGEKASISLMTLYDIIDVSGKKHFQLILHPGNEMELRIANDVGKEAAFEEVKESVLGYLANMGINKASMYLSDEEPQKEHNKRKFRSIYQIV